MQVLAEHNGIIYGWERSENQLDLISYVMDQQVKRQNGSLKDMYMSSLMSSCMIGDTVYYAYSSMLDETTYEIKVAAYSYDSDVETISAGKSSAGLVYMCRSDNVLVLYYMNEAGESLVSTLNPQNKEIVPILHGGATGFVYQISVDPESGLIYTLEQEDISQSALGINVYTLAGELVQSFAGSEDLQEICNTYINLMNVIQATVYVENFSGEMLLFQLNESGMETIFKGTNEDLTATRGKYSENMYFFKMFSNRLYRYDMEQNQFVEYETTAQSISNVVECEDWFVIWDFETRGMMLSEKPD